MSYAKTALLLLSIYASGCSEGYDTYNGKNVWYNEWNQGAGERKMFYLEDADGEMDILSDPRYAKTEDNVYFQGCKILGADPDSFQLLEYPFSKDKNNVYICSLYLIDADPENFTILHNDPNLGMVGNPTTIERGHGNHPALNQVESLSSKSAWSTDGNTVYYSFAKVKGADPQSFASLNNAYGKDKDNVFYKTNIVAGADLATFECRKSIVGSGNAKDKNFYYEDGKQVSPRE